MKRGWWIVLIVSLLILAGVVFIVNENINSGSSESGYDLLFGNTTCNNFNFEVNVLSDTEIEITQNAEFGIIYVEFCGAGYRSPVKNPISPAGTYRINMTPTVMNVELTPYYINNSRDILCPRTVNVDF